MRITDEELKYIKGDKFDDMYIFKIKDKFDNNSRIEKILEITKNKKVIHLGCCDHIPLIKERIENNMWLHKLLTDNCKKVLGIDINKEAIDYIVNEVGYSNLEFWNICEKGNKNIEKEKWDYIVVGEILEHVDNPVEFLQKIQENYNEYIEGIIITVPNILCEYRIKKNKSIYGEIINSDHRYWFTPFTILKVGNNSGLEEMKLYFVNLTLFKWANFFTRVKNKINKITKKKLFKFKFYNFSTLILVAKLKKEINYEKTR